MTLTSANVRVAVTGAVSLGTGSFVAPTNANATLTGATDLGYVGSDGLTMTPDRSTTAITAWQYAANVRTVITDSSVVFAFKLIETKKEVIEAAFATTVDPTTGSFTYDPGATGGRKPWVFDVVDGTHLQRFWVPEGELVDAMDDVTFASGEEIGYSLSVTAYPSSQILKNGQPQSFKAWMSDLVVTP